MIVIPLASPSEMPEVLQLAQLIALDELDEDTPWLTAINERHYRWSLMNVDPNLLTVTLNRAVAWALATQLGLNPVETGVWAEDGVHDNPWFDPGDPVADAQYEYLAWIHQ